MSLRSKKSLEKLFAESRERAVKRKIKEAERRKKFNKWLEKNIEIEKRKEKMWTKSFLNAIKDDSEWYKHWDSMDISMHSVEIISILSNKKTLNDNEQSVLDFAFGLAYPNGI